VGQPTVHIIGAGLAGLAAAVRLVGGLFAVVLHEAARQAGGRCRSYYDPSLGMIIDNGNHLLLSGNHQALGYLERIGSKDQLKGPAQADFAFFDIATGKHWRLRPNSGLFPWWVFVPSRRVPGSRARDYFSLWRLFLPGQDAPLGALVPCEGLLYERLWHPFFLAALNTDPREGSALLAASVFRETLARGGSACRPLIARRGLSAAFVEPALAFLKRQGATIFFDHRLRRIEYVSGRAASLDFGTDPQPLGLDDGVILAVPPQMAGALVPGLQAPKASRAIINAHFKVSPPMNLFPLIGVINGTVEWLFAFEDRLSVTISGADRLLDFSREELASLIWADVAKVAQIDKPMPPWQVIKEKRATFAATVEENTRRPGSASGYANLHLAGDWTATGLPATIEGAIRSGDRAARAYLHQQGVA